ncbi:hypothetical protein [uncultured Dysosmobacter sp.]|uniref:hypothetical protein n=1 Tax=uncultured Dysosmobacter sp. TaxID=2591384 RepID=UPI002622148F|nr:hypothetical protein [uncultured Dysosmobacter sp.]
MKRLLISLLLLCLLTGCGTAPPPEETVSPVYTDWSKLTPREEEAPLYTRFEPYSGSGPLQPRDDYGQLLPYIGAELTVDNYICDALPLYGLTTADGQVVTEPVYASISMENGFLLLWRGSDQLYQQEGSQLERGDFDLTIAAPDGSWVRTVDGYYVYSTEGLLVTADQGNLFYWNDRGELVHQFSADIFRPYLGDRCAWNDEGGPWLDQADGRVVYLTSYNHSPDGDQPLRLYLDLEQEAVRETPPDGYPAEIDYESLYEEPPEFPGYRNVWNITDPVTGVRYYYAYTDTEGPPERRLLSETGEVLLPDFDSLWILFPQIINGCVACVDYQDAISMHMAGGTFRWQRLDTGACVFRFPIRSNSE